jgi:riboflavin synthase
MFTGIVENTALLVQKNLIQGNLVLWFESTIVQELKIDQSVMHNGICLTVDDINASQYRITAIEETISKTNIGDWNEGDIVNIERCVALGARLDGHIVQGHVDDVAICSGREEKEGSIVFTFKINPKFSALVIEKGSVALDGISLTCHQITEDTFNVSLIPYTLSHTNANAWQVGSKVNIEFDVLGKYIAKLYHKSNPSG